MDETLPIPLTNTIAQHLTENEPWRKLCAIQLKDKLKENIFTRTKKLEDAVNLATIKIPRDNTLQIVTNPPKFEVSTAITNEAASRMCDAIDKWPGVHSTQCINLPLVFKNYWRIADIWWNRQKGKWFGDLLFQPILGSSLHKYCQNILVNKNNQIAYYYLFFFFLHDIIISKVSFKKGRPVPLIFDLAIEKSTKLQSWLTLAGNQHGIKWDVSKSNKTNTYLQEWVEQVLEIKKSRYLLSIPIKRDNAMKLQSKSNLDHSQHRDNLNDHNRNIKSQDLFDEKDDNIASSLSVDHNNKHDKHDNNNNVNNTIIGLPPPINPLHNNNDNNTDKRSKIPKSPQLRQSMDLPPPNTSRKPSPVCLRHLNQSLSASNDGITPPIHSNGDINNNNEKGNELYSSFADLVTFDHEKNRVPSGFSMDEKDGNDAEQTATLQQDCTKSSQGWEHSLMKLQQQAAARQWRSLQQAFNTHASLPQTYQQQTREHLQYASTTQKEEEEIQMNELNQVEFLPQPPRYNAPFVSEMYRMNNPPPLPPPSRETRPSYCNTAQHFMNPALIKLDQSSYTSEPSLTSTNTDIGTLGTGDTGISYLSSITASHEDQCTHLVSSVVNGLQQQPKAQQELLKIIEQQKLVITLLQNSHQVLIHNCKNPWSLSSPMPFMQQVNNLQQQKAAQNVPKMSCAQCDTSDTSKSNRKKRKCKKKNKRHIQPQPNSKRDKNTYYCEPSTNIRVKKNIKIPIEFISKIKSKINVNFNKVKCYANHKNEDECKCNGLYSWIDNDIAMQFNHKKVNKYDKNIKIYCPGFVDHETSQDLYFIIEAAEDNNHDQNTNKWEMKQVLYTKQSIIKEYKLNEPQLPNPVRESKRFKNQLFYKQIITEILKDPDKLKELIDETNWNKIQIFSKLNNKRRKPLLITKPELQRDLNDNMIKKKMDLIPIILWRGNKCEIHHLWVTQIDDTHIGISLIYEEKDKKVKISGIHVDKGMISKQHQWISLEHVDCECLINFKTTINHMVIGNVDYHENLVKDLKGQIEKIKQANIR